MTNTILRLKAENFQRTGAFKIRGAVNAVLQLGPEERQRGVVTMSAGNHGQALAYAASLFDIRCVVFMAENAAASKVAAIRGYGAEIRFGPKMETLRAAMDDFIADQGFHLVHPFADLAIIAGQATVGLEILEDAPDVEAVIVPVGGGGLLSGTLLSIKQKRPTVRVIGVEPVGAAVVSKSLEAGRPLTLDKIETIADGLSAPFAAPLNQGIIERYVDDVVLVTDDEIANALGLILDRCKMLVEPAGAAATAALLSGKTGVSHGDRVVSILSGGNVDRERLKQML